MPFYDRTIEYMILTHGHSDHAEGLLEVAKRYSITTFICNGIDEGNEELLKEFLEQDTNVISISKEESFTIGNNSFIEILFPDHTLFGNELVKLNDSSVISRFVYQETSMLFTGDASKQIETHLVNKDAKLSSNIIQIGHHGSKTSSDSRFLDAVRPEYGVISVGKNSYGHPHQRTLSALRRASISILRTDEEGDIHFVSDGKVFVRVYP